MLTKLGSFTAEMDEWILASEAGKSAEKHNSQIRRVAAQLRPLAERVRRSIEAQDLAQHWLEREENILDLYRVWGYFRDKIALRRSGGYEDYLVLADEFAWACYEPAQRIATEKGTVDIADVREPPLVYLNTSSSPFSVSRGQSYAAAAGELSTRAARVLVERLPVPVIGVPWFALRHLPDALVIAHEVGHLVLAEIVGLDEVQNLLVSTMSTRSDQEKQQWLHWTEEAFADVYGVLCGGEAYVDVLADFLFVDGISRDSPNSPYPPPSTRLGLVREALRLADHLSRSEASRVGATTSADYLDASNSPAGQQVDATTPPNAAAARALVAGRFPALGGNRLFDIIKPPAQGDDQVQELLDGWQPETMDIRSLLAVTARAFSVHPTRFGDKNCQTRVLAKARIIQQPGTRYLDGDPRAVLSQFDQPDQSRIDALYSLLTGGAGAPPPAATQREN